MADYTSYPTAVPGSEPHQINEIVNILDTGTFTADVNMIYTGDNFTRISGADATFTVAEDKSVRSSNDTTIQMESKNFNLDNAGTIRNADLDNSGDELALSLQMTGTDADLSVVTNTGSMGAILAAAPGGEGLSVTNSGSIFGTANPVFDASLVTGDIFFTNSGFIGASSVADADLLLGSGDDTYDGSGGGFVLGTIKGGDGDDFIILGDSVERVDGGDGTDSVSYDAVDYAVTVDLLRGTGVSKTGVDQIAGIENIGGGGKDDLLGGTHESNVIDGEDGEDRISARGGDDWLHGGAGADRMHGGVGNDAFYFDNADEGGDFIFDFSRTAGNVDTIQINGANFGGLSAGMIDRELFSGLRTNVAQEADDRFLFDLRDKSLWFDEDGLGGADAVLLADLQNDAVMSAYSIVIV